MLKITPKPVVGKSSFRVTFRHPLEGNKPKTFGLGTDEIVASMVCKDVEAIANDAELLHNPEKHRVRLATSYEARAVEIVFGKRAVALLADAVKPGVLDVEEEKDLSGSGSGEGALRRKELRSSFCQDGSHGEGRGKQGNRNPPAFGCQGHHGLCLGGTAEDYPQRDSTPAGGP
ncbi:MAG: hypothetical protein M5U26_23645 [Planctomycetota bacterium]|nr:hypothetical protein [Planctomycetota bacterium]